MIITTLVHKKIFDGIIVVAHCLEPKATYLIGDNDKDDNGFNKIEKKRGSSGSDGNKSKLIFCEYIYILN